jgi:hypothetical protein
MATVDIISFIVSLVPFLNAGLIILIIDLLLRCSGFEISKKEFTRHPIWSLLFGLGLILLSYLINLLVQGWLSQMQISQAPFSLFLILIYFIIVFNMTEPSKRKRKHR